MKVGILSDTHFGFGWGTLKENDSFKQAEDAILKLIEKKVDFIILAGDVFDSKTPPPEILTRAIDALSIAKKRKTNLSAENVDSKLTEGTPIVAIHGTHERRTGGSETALELLEKVGILIHLHHSTVVLKKDDEKIAVHGLSGVPEISAKTIMKTWNPLPIKDAKNILVFHQNLFPFIYTGNSSAGLKLSDLPEDFDLYIDGHIHNPVFTDYCGAPVIITGSTVLTQMRKSEKDSKLAWIWESDSGKIEKIEIETRPFIYIEIESKGETPSELKERIEKLIEGKPEDALVKVKLKGRLKAGYSSAEIFPPKVNPLISIDRFLSSEQKNEPRPVDETATELLSKKLKELGFSNKVDIGKLYPLLIEGDVEKAVKLMENSQ